MTLLGKIFRPKHTAIAKPEGPAPTLADIEKQYTERQATTLAYLEAELKHMQAKGEAIKASYDGLMTDTIESEYAARQDINNRKHAELKPITAEIARLQELITAHPYDQRYPRLRMECLGLMKIQGGLQVPAFSIFSMTEPGCHITAEADWDRSCRRPMPNGSEMKPEGFWQEFRDAQKALSKWAMAACSRRNTHKFLGIYDAFEGIVPASLRAAVVQARKEFESLYFIAEARWRTEYIPQTEPAKGSREMLLTGMRKHDEKRLYWLITRLRTQTTDEYVQEARGK